MLRFFTKIGTLLILLAFVSACKVTRFLDDDQALVRKHTITFADTITDSRKLSGSLHDLASPEPNTTFLGYHLGVRAYYWSQDTSKGINRWMRRRLAQTPALLDTAMVSQSVASMEQYLFNKGYFNCHVSAAVRYKNKRTPVALHAPIDGPAKVQIGYTIQRNPLKKIHAVHYQMPDSNMYHLVVHNARQPVILQAGQPYDVEAILDERRRIESILQNNGYYTFDRQQLLFQIDTLPGGRQLDIYVSVYPPENDSMHRVWQVNNIYILPDHQTRLLSESAALDTLVIGGYHFVYDVLRYNPEALIQAIFLHPGDNYRKRDYQLTLDRLTSLRIFRFVNIDVVPVERAGNPALDFVIKLIPAEQREVGFNVNATTSSLYFLGSDAGISYINKNLFNFTDIFTFGLNGGVEMIVDSASGFRFNTVDLNAKAALQFPKFLVPFSMNRVPKTHNAKTNIVANYNYFRRVNYYTLNNLTLAYGFDWNEFNFARHSLNPIEVNFVRVTDTTAAFLRTIQEAPSLQRSFQDVLIAGSNYTYIYSSQHKNNKDFWYYRFRIEAAGNLLYGASSLLGGNQENGIYQLANRPFSQFVKPELEIKHYNRYRNDRTLVMRLLAGVGFAYGNTDLMPYIKQFTIGGSNSIRAFRIRELGPGSSQELIRSDASNVFNDRSGEIKLEGNIEYRFPISSMFKGAVFTDFGNIWMRKDDPDREGEDFSVDRFYKEIAVGIGAGLRIDFSFFIARIDLGLPVRDPRLPEGSRWRFKQYWFPTVNPFSGYWRQENMRIQLAIGYPF